MPGGDRDGGGHGEALLVAGSPVVLKGRMDRIAEKDGRYGVIDYKTRQSFPKSVYLGDEETLPGSYQLPFYVYLLEASGKPVDSCSLYILTDGEYKHLYREEAKAWADREQVEELVGTMFAQIKRLAEGIESGDYMVEENECGGCPYRPVCRARYALG
jgi:RecB family exonuclease